MNRQRTIASGALVLAFLAPLLATSCEQKIPKHPYNLDVVRREGDQIVAAIKAYQKETGTRFSGRFSELVPKYLPELPPAGGRTGGWEMSAGYQLRETDTILLIFRLLDDEEWHLYYLYDDTQGWSVQKLSAI